MGRRGWIKIHVDGWLRGRLKDESPALKGIFVSILALAGDSAYGDDGIIQVDEGMGYTDKQLQNMIGVTRSEWQKAKKSLIETDRISVAVTNVIQVLNWSKYQSEYERQKPYRLNKLLDKVTSEGDSGDIEGERERDREREKKREEKLKILWERFDVFWKVYPRKDGKVQAKRAWFKLDPDPELLDTIIKAIAKQSKTPQWTVKGPRGESYVPHPSTWLNGMRWEDEEQDVGASAVDGWKAK